MIDLDARIVEGDARLAAGDARGELISVQCELERGGFDRARGISLRRREADLLAAHAKAWANLEGLATHPVFRRGAVAEATINAKLFVQREAEVFARAPALSWLDLTHLDQVPPPYELQPRLLEDVLASGRVRAFGITGACISWSVEGAFVDSVESSSLATPIVQWLSRNGHLAKLRGLGLGYVEPTTLELIAREAINLDDLRLIGDLAGGSIAASTLRPTRLELSSRDDITGILAQPIASAARELAVSALVPCLDHIPASTRILRGYAKTGDDLARIATAPALAAVEDLTLEKAHWAAFDVMRLFDAPGLTSLRVLRIAPSNLSKERARGLLTSPLAARLEAIDLRPAPDDLKAAVLTCDWDGALLL